MACLIAEVLLTPIGFGVSELILYCFTAWATPFALIFPNMKWVRLTSLIEVSLTPLFWQLNLASLFQTFEGPVSLVFRFALSHNPKTVHQGSHLHGHDGDEFGPLHVGRTVRREDAQN